MQNWNSSMFFVNNMFSVHSINSMVFILHFPGDTGILVPLLTWKPRCSRQPLKHKWLTFLHCWCTRPGWTPSGQPCWLVTGMCFWCGTADQAHVPYWLALDQVMPRQYKTWPGRRRNQTLRCGGSWQDMRQWAQTETYDVPSAHTKTFLVWGWLNIGAVSPEGEGVCTGRERETPSWTPLTQPAGAAELGWVVSRGPFQHWFCASVTVPLFAYLLPHHSHSI